MSSFINLRPTSLCRGRQQQRRSCNPIDPLCLVWSLRHPSPRAAARAHGSGTALTRSCSVHRRELHVSSAAVAASPASNDATDRGYSSRSTRASSANSHLAIIQSSQPVQALSRSHPQQRSTSSAPAMITLPARLARVHPPPPGQHEPARAPALPCGKPRVARDCRCRRRCRRATAMRTRWSCGQSRPPSLRP